MTPKSIKIEDKNLIIIWQNDKKTAIGLEYLREQCPCANCKGETILLRTIRPPKRISTGEAMYKIKSIDLVGNYAVKISWADGHDTGVYSWEYLDDLAKGETDNKEFDYKPLL